MNRPRILITASNVSSSALEGIVGDTDILYSDRATAAAVITAGGLPLYMPAMEALKPGDFDMYLSMVDGVLLTGADTNTNPVYYGEQPTHLAGRIDDERDRIDIALVQRAYQKRIPLLGICKGMQVLAVGLGGTLYQNVLVQHPGAFDHDVRKTSRANITHKATLTKGSVLADIFKAATMPLNGGHQQAVKALPDALRPIAIADDGIVEAFDALDYPFLLGIQFHAELRLSDAPFAEIFKRLVAAAADFRAQS